jgi:hypothetical protein
MRRSSELSGYIKNIATNISSNHELVQFVPMKFFTNEQIYFPLLEFNNQSLKDSIDEVYFKRKKSKDYSTFMG